MSAIQREVKLAAIHEQVRQALLSAAERLQAARKKTHPWPQLAPFTPILIRDSMNLYTTKGIVVVAYTNAQYEYLFPDKEFNALLGMMSLKRKI